MYPFRIVKPYIFSKNYTKNKSLYPNAHSQLTEARLGPFLAAHIRAAVDVLPENKTLGWGPVGTRKIRNPDRRSSLITK